MGTESHITDVDVASVQVPKREQYQMIDGVTKTLKKWKGKDVYSKAPQAWIDRAKASHNRILEMRAKKR